MAIFFMVLSSCVGPAISSDRPAAEGLGRQRIAVNLLGTSPQGAGRPGTSDRPVAFTTLKAEVKTRELIIIGGGPAGYTAALYAARADLEPLVIEGFQWGGQLMITSDVENYPGYADGVMGPEMMSDFRRQAERFGAEFITDDVTKVDFSEQPHRVFVGDDDYTARAVIIATGATARFLGIPSEEKHKGRGVSACATCDAAFFRDKDVYVVGGGDSAFEEALFLTKFASHVHLVHRRDEFRASRIMVDRADRNEKLDYVLNAVVDEIIGDVKVEGLRLRSTVTDETWEVPADGLFVAIGHDPSTALFVDHLDHDDQGYLVTSRGSTATNIPGVFAAGDVQDHTYRQAITAAGSGCMAALDAERFLASLEGHPGTALTAGR
jgi:thioredoxin reductase (NADPH)